MSLSLSSAALSAAPLGQLLAACGRRGLAALELVDGDGHGLSATTDPDQIHAVRNEAADSQVSLCGFYAPSVEVGDLEKRALLAAALGAPIIVPADVASEAGIPHLLDLVSRAGTRLLIAHDTDPLLVKSLVRWIESASDGHAVGLAWEVRPGYDDPGQIAEVLAAAGDHLAYVRLYGGGPESDQQTGLGVGTLMARLALAHFGGPIVLTPSDPQYHYIWSVWAGANGGWGCGSKQSDPSLVTLRPVTNVPAFTQLDVRPVEPKHRLESIMGAYDSLPPGGTLDLTVDHDPKCMYYTLKAMHGEEQFQFEYRESGPVVWRVEVQKRLQN